MRVLNSKTDILFHAGRGIMLTLLLAFSLFSAAQADTLPAACLSECVTPYGKVLGSHGDVAAFSNCNAACVVYEPNRVDGTFTGIQWQCVEYARRWLLINHGVVFGDVDIAADIWGHDQVTRVADGASLPLSSYVNGSKELPQVGDLLIYAREFLGTGHVAVITEVDANTGRIAVAEQNYLNDAWSGEHARHIEMLLRDGQYWLLDPFLLGWKRL